MSLVSIKMIAVNAIKSSLVSMELYTFVQTNPKVEGANYFRTCNRLIHRGSLSIVIQSHISM